MTPKVVYPEYDDSVEEEEIFQSEDSQVFIFKTLMNLNMVKTTVLAPYVMLFDLGYAWYANRMLVEQ